VWEYLYAIATSFAALALAILAIALNKRKDVFQLATMSAPQPLAQKDKLVTSAWWDASDRFQPSGVSHGQNSNSSSRCTAELRFSPYLTYNFDR
jgi:hypothetical protein